MSHEGGLAFGWKEKSLPKKSLERVVFWVAQFKKNCAYITKVSEKYSQSRYLKMEQIYVS